MKINCQAAEYTMQNMQILSPESHETQEKEEKQAISQETTPRNGVTLSISSEGLSFLEKQMEGAKKSGDAIEDLGKLMEIARRIANGDKVPASDEKKLMEFNADLYQAAKAAALVNDDKEHKKYKKLFEEEEEGEENMRNKIRAIDSEASAAHAASVVASAAVPEAEVSADMGE